MADKRLYDAFPYVLLVVTVLAVAWQIVGRTATVSIAEQPDTAISSLPEAADREAPAVAVVLYIVGSGWWELAEQEKDRAAGQFLAVLVDADGKLGVSAWGISGLGLQKPGFALVLEHPDPLVLRNVLCQLAVLPAAEWFRTAVHFYGTPTAVNSILSAAVSAASSPRLAALLLERRSTEWFLLSPEKRTQLLNPRQETLRRAAVELTRCYSDLGFGPYSELTVLEGLDLLTLADIRNNMRAHWEQKYTETTQVYVGLRLSATDLLNAMRQSQVTGR